MESEVNVYTNGPVHCSVCAPMAMTRQQVEDEVNRTNPTGIGSKWKVSDEDFKGGEPNGVACNDDADRRRHWLMVC